MLFASALRVVASATANRLSPNRTPGMAGSALLAMTGVLAGSLAGCSGKPFNVKPRPSLSKSDYRASGQIDGVGIQAEPITDEDYLFEVFDANLIQAGVYPVRIRVKNNGGDALELKRAKFGVKSAAGKRFRVVDARPAYKRLISFYELSLYSKDGYKRSLNDFKSYAFDTESPLGPGDSRDGILFFLVPAEVAQEGGLTFEAARLSKQSRTDSGLELKLK